MIVCLLSLLAKVELKLVFIASPTRPLLEPPIASPSPRTRALSSPAVPNGFAPPIHLHTTSPPPEGRRSSRSVSPSPSPKIGNMPSFSLVGALEFRDVVHSLQRQSAASTLTAFESPVSPYVGGHYHSPQLNRRHSSYSATRTDESDDHRSRSGEMDPWEAALGLHMHRVPRSARSPARSPSPEGDNEVPSSPRNEARRLRPTISIPGQIPLISTTPASPRSETSTIDVENFGAVYGGSDSPSQPRVRISKRRKVLQAFRHTLHILFPTLHDFRRKSWMGMIASILATPAVLALTVTLPVFVMSPPSDEDEKLDGYANGHNGVLEGRLVDFEEEGIERHLTAAAVASEIEREDMEDHYFNKYLMASQLLLGPLFSVAVLFAHNKNEIWLLGATGVASLAAATLVLVFADRGNDRMAQMGRCFMGFAVAVVWIMAIADEVVNVLKVCLSGHAAVLFSN